MLLEETKDYIFLLVVIVYETEYTTYSKIELQIRENYAPKNIHKTVMRFLYNYLCVHNAILLVRFK
jgi:hypothetical protein